MNGSRNKMKQRDEADCQKTLDQGFTVAESEEQGGAMVQRMASRGSVFKA